jgi:CYTH domain-containing protein
VSNPTVEIERKFLVREATLRDVEGLKLIEIESIYLDIDRIVSKGEDLGLLGFANQVGHKEVRISKSECEDKVEYWMTTKIGGPNISRDESMIELDEAEYLKLAGNLGSSILRKKRFKFDYLRNTFELDVFPDDKMMVMEVELESEGQFFALPPFVNIVREVTGEPEYYSGNIAQPVTITIEG